VVQLVISTSLLGSGTDYHAVCDVINVGFPYTMFDFEQQIDRGGRDGLPVRGTTLVREKEKAPFIQDDESNRAHSKAECRRVQPSLYFDGSAVTCTLVKGNFCDTCDGQSSQEPPAFPKPIPTSSVRDLRASRPNSQRPTAPYPSATTLKDRCAF
jgi:superfamily II DNA helicase RecQ